MRAGAGAGAVAGAAYQPLGECGQAGCHAGKEDEAGVADVRQEGDGQSNSRAIATTWIPGNGNLGTATLAAASLAVGDGSPAAAGTKERGVEGDCEENGLVDGREGARGASESSAGEGEAAAAERRGGGDGEDGALSSGSGGLRFVLALRKWFDWRPEREFRCFVVAGRLRGERGAQQSSSMLQAMRGHVGST